jgi:transcriptional regulator with XRE-family HTH domain
MNIGSKLKELRTNWGKTLDEVSRYIGISTDMMSKIERGERKPTVEVLKKLTLYYNLHEDDLLIYYYSEEVYGLLEKVEIRNTIIKEVKKKFEDDGYEYRIRNINPLKPEKVRKKRVTKNGLNRVRGFGFYIQNNDKLSKKNRDILLTRGEHYMGIIHGELDSSLTDLEIVDDWNRFFQEYGFRFPEFENEWIKVYGKPSSDSKPTRRKKSDKEFTPPKSFSDFLNKKNKPISGFE